MVLRLPTTGIAFTRALCFCIKYIPVLQEFFRRMAMDCQSTESCRALRVWNYRPATLSLQPGPRTAGTRYKRGRMDCLWLLLGHRLGRRTLLARDTFGAYTSMVYTRAHMAIERYLATESPSAVTAAGVWRRGVRQMPLKLPRSSKGPITRRAVTRHSRQRIYSLRYKGRNQVK